jgi:hypothetical protein
MLGRYSISTSSCCLKALHHDRVATGNPAEGTDKSTWQRAVDCDQVGRDRMLLKILQSTTEATNRSVEGTSVGCGLGIHNYRDYPSIVENYNFLFCRR